MLIATWMPNAFQVVKKTLWALLLAPLCFLLSLTSMRAAGLAQASDQTDALLADAKNFFGQSKFAEADRTVRQYLEGHQNSADGRSEEHTSELQSRRDLVCRLL